MHSNTIIYSELNLLSFPDSQVNKIHMDFKNKSIKLFVDGAYLDKNNGLIFESGVLFINNWQSFEVNIYSAEEGWQSNFDELTDIAEFLVLDETIKLKGFGKKTGKWIEYKFSKAKAYFKGSVASVVGKENPVIRQ